MKQFNYCFIYNGDGTFTPEDYQKIASAEQIRNASDYDDFYVASKEETIQLVENTKYIVDKIDSYIVERICGDEAFPVWETDEAESAKEDMEQE